MDEARRFLRFVAPGLVFLTIVLLLLWLIVPWWLAPRLLAFSTSPGLGVVIATLLASGGLGALLSTIHHTMHWHLDSRAVDHRGFVTRLRQAGVVRLMDATSGVECGGDVDISRSLAWSILTALWHQRIGATQSLVGAEPKAALAMDQVHAAGTARVAAGMAWVVALCVAASVSTFDFGSCTVALFVAGNAVGCGLLWLHQSNYLRLSALFQSLMEEVLTDVLVKEKATDKRAIDTWIVVQP